MKKGDRIRIIKVPPGLRDDEDLRTKSLFERCLNHVFPIKGIEYGLLKLDVGEVVGRPASMHTIWIEPEYVERADKQRRARGARGA